MNMDPSNFIFKNPQAQSFDLKRTTFQTDISYALVENILISDIKEYGLFLVHFNYIPNFIQSDFIDCKKANEWLLKTFSEPVLIE